MKEQRDTEQDKETQNEFLRKIKEAESSRSPAGYAAGDKVRLTADIWDDGEDHHPPGYIAKKGQTVIVRGVNISSLSVSHEHITNNSFRVLMDEVEAA